MHHEDVGERVRRLIDGLEDASTHREIAQSIEMTTDAFSRALNGKRAFSSMELARVADVLGADIHFLITGQPDPNRLVVAARHDYDFSSGRRQVPGRAGDQAVLEDIGLAYQQAYDGVPPEVPQPLPSGVDKIRAQLGDAFVRPFIEQLEIELGIHVVRVDELSTDYSMSIAGRHVITVVATGNWFRENWSLAHELGHLVLGHLDATQREEHEHAANAFAANLLLPAAVLRATDWTQLEPNELAQLVWDLGISTDALERRLKHLSVPTSPQVSELLRQPTQRLLRHHWRPRKSPSRGIGQVDPFIDEISDRMDAAATRRFPSPLQRAHLDKIAAGQLGKGTLAWMLHISGDHLEVETPAAPTEMDSATLASMLGH